MAWSLSDMIDPEGMKAAAHALGEQLGADAEEQCAYLHRFADGKVSLELEWIDPALLARAAVDAYLTAILRRQVSKSRRN